jgi:hypothetical protein
VLLTESAAVEVGSFVKFPGGVAISSSAFTRERVPIAPVLDESRHQVGYVSYALMAGEIRYPETSALGPTTDI